MLAERTGLAHVPRAADCPAGQSLRAHCPCPSAGTDTLTAERKKGPISRTLPLILAERTGLEPATPGVTGRYSNQLNYRSVYSDHDFDRPSEFGWWALRGSNSRPNPCKGSALPTELSARSLFRGFYLTLVIASEEARIIEVRIRGVQGFFEKNVEQTKLALFHGPDAFVQPSWLATTRRPP